MMNANQSMIRESSDRIHYLPLQSKYKYPILFEAAGQTPNLDKIKYISTLGLCKEYNARERTRTLSTCRLLIIISY